MFLVNYYQNLKSGLAEYRGLEANIATTFSLSLDDAQRFGESQVRPLEIMCGLITGRLCKNEHRMLDLKTKLLASLPSSITAFNLVCPLLFNPSGFFFDYGDDCGICSEDSPGNTTIKNLEHYNNTIGELAIRERRLQRHFDAVKRERHGAEEDFAPLKTKISRCYKLSNMVREQANNILEEITFPLTPRWRGLHHAWQTIYANPPESPSFRDCLGRTALHIIMDGRGSYIHFSYPLKTDFINVQDYWSRVPLHIARRYWLSLRDIEAMSDSGADPGIRTNNGSLPIHYAAAVGSTRICESLLRLANKFDVNGKDSLGKTALDYAKKKGHTGVIELTEEQMSKMSIVNSVEKSEEPASLEPEQDQEESAPGKRKMNEEDMKVIRDAGVNIEVLRKLEQVGVLKLCLDLRM